MFCTFVDFALCTASVFARPVRLLAAKNQRTARTSPRLQQHYPHTYPTMSVASERCVEWFGSPPTRSLRASAPFQVSYALRRSAAAYLMQRYEHSTALHAESVQIRSLFCRRFRVDRGHQSPRWHDGARSGWASCDRLLLPPHACQLLLFSVRVQRSLSDISLDEMENANTSWVGGTGTWSIYLLGMPLFSPYPARYQLPAVACLGARAAAVCNSVPSPGRQPPSCQPRPCTPEARPAVPPALALDLWLPG